MRRTQIYLPESTYRVLVKLRKQRKQSIAQIIRDVLNRNLIAGELESEELDVESLANLKLSGGPKDLSENLDDYLYGK